MHVFDRTWRYFAHVDSLSVNLMFDTFDIGHLMVDLNVTTARGGSVT